MSLFKFNGLYCGRVTGGKLHLAKSLRTTCCRPRVYGLKLLSASEVLSWPKLCKHCATPQAWERVRGAARRALGQVVHHIDGDPYNNSIENLAIMNRTDHV